MRGSLAGSVVSNILLVLGVALIFGGQGGHGRPLDRFSLLLQLGLVLVATVLFLVPSVPGWTGNPERHDLARADDSRRDRAARPLRRGDATSRCAGTSGCTRRAATRRPRAAGRLPVSLVALGAATVVTALISETLVHSLHAFAEAAGLSEFFIAAVIVAIVGNAAEHGGAIVIASRGKLRLATEIAVSSSAQVALLVTPAVALLSWLVRPALPLTFRPVELAAMGGAAALVALLVADGRGRRWEGFLLVAVYVGVAFGFYVAGDR